MLFLTAGGVKAAPLPPMPAVTLTGVIEKVVWVDARKVKGKPGFSGSLGRDRVFPAHYVVTLRDYTLPKSVAVGRLNNLVGARTAKADDPSVTPPRLTVWINSGERGQLQPGMRIRLKRYVITGDEGGTWVEHDPVEIMGQ